MNITQILKDKMLLGQFIKDPSTWRAWFCFLRAFFALKPTSGDKDIFQQATGRSEWPQDASKEAWLVDWVKGRQVFHLSPHSDVPGRFLQI